MRLRLPGRSPGQTDDATVRAAGPVRRAAPPGAGRRGHRCAGADRRAAAPSSSARPGQLAIASAQFLLIAAAVVVLFWVLGKLWSILLPIVLGLLIATVLWPTTRFLRKHRWPPALAASTVLLAAVAILVGIIAAIAPSVADQVTELSDAATTRAAGRPGMAAGPAVQLR